MAILFGDPNLNPTLSGEQHAKNQTLTGDDNLHNNALIGDVRDITDHATGGNDTLIGPHPMRATSKRNMRFIDDDAILDYPQSEERIRGRRHIQFSRAAMWNAHA